MKKYLVIETSTQRQLFGIVENGELVASFEHYLATAGSNGVVKKILELTEGSTVDAIVIGEGPGSYTGLRIGYAIAQALQFAWNCPLLGACSLAAYGQSEVVSDARSGGVYVWDGDHAHQLPLSELSLERALIPFHQPQLKEKLASQVAHIKLVECALEQLVHKARPNPAPLYLRPCSATLEGIDNK